ncbi:hypothetical protein [Cupriavidus sp. AcVe19-6a]|uniref:hypothetical protein n=1 Tax=Cupriavidus sp. AcVe19-6a TaxID=2821358 RepID=UPI001AE26444|nr:hypothetical protein [Cupriavidus sp. AcVe19-6a]MBP0638986.1 hypothetical protein [Cupriavidus sp. AcVe19-6a]
MTALDPINTAFEENRPMTSRRADAGDIANRNIASTTPHSPSAIGPAFRFAPRPLAFAVHIAMAGTLVAAVGWMPEASAQERAAQSGSAGQNL